jgi:hypothetical protein
MKQAATIICLMIATQNLFAEVTKPAPLSPGLEGPLFYCPVLGIYAGGSISLINGSDPLGDRLPEDLNNVMIGAGWRAGLKITYNYQHAVFPFQLLVFSFSYETLYSSSKNTFKDADYEEYVMQNPGERSENSFDLDREIFQGFLKIGAFYKLGFYKTRCFARLGVEQSILIDNNYREKLTVNNSDAEAGLKPDLPLQKYLSSKEAIVFEGQREDSHSLSFDVFLGFGMKFNKYNCILLYEPTLDLSFSPAPIYGGKWDTLNRFGVRLGLTIWYIAPREDIGLNLRNCFN